MMILIQINLKAKKRMSFKTIVTHSRVVNKIIHLNYIFFNINLFFIDTQKIDSSKIKEDIFDIFILLNSLLTNNSKSKWFTIYIY